METIQRGRRFYGNSSAFDISKYLEPFRNISKYFEVFRNISNIKRRTVSMKPTSSLDRSTGSRSSTNPSRVRDLAR